MFEPDTSEFSLPHWTTLVVVGAGILAFALVVVLAVLVRRWWRRRRLSQGLEVEDLDWDDLLELLRRRGRQRKEAGLQPHDDVSAEEFMDQLLAGLTAQALRAPAGQPARGGAERRASRRCWANLTEVHVTAPLWADPLRGLVINQSAGGLALFVNKDIPVGTAIRVRAAEAPDSLPAAEAEVRYCRKAGKNFLVGCAFSGDVPWNVRAWFV
jgi:hypothetical protein